MDLSHTYYKEIPVDEDNILSANFSENNKVEHIEFKKSKIYAISGLSIDQDSQSNVSLPNVEVEKALSDILRTYAEEKTKFNLDLKIYKENYFDINAPFQKSQRINGFQYYDTTTQKQETIEFFGYYYYLKIFGFTWEHASLELNPNLGGVSFTLLPSSPSPFWFSVNNSETVKTATLPFCRSQ